MHTAPDLLMTFSGLRRQPSGVKARGTRTATLTYDQEQKVHVGQERHIYLQQAGSLTKENRTLATHMYTRA